MCIEKNYSEAIYWLKNAANADLADAQALLARCYESGTGVARDEIKAVELYKKAADGGNAQAKLALEKLNYT